jgi:hypothetical protein
VPRARCCLQKNNMSRRKGTLASPHVRPSAAFSAEIVSEHSGTRLRFEKLRTKRDRRTVHPTKKLHGLVTQVDRPLPPGEGRGEGLVQSRRSLSVSLIVVSVERSEGVLLLDETGPHRYHVRRRPFRIAVRGQQLRHASRACGNVTLTAERLVAAAPHPNPLPEGEGDRAARHEHASPPLSGLHVGCKRQGAWSLVVRRHRRRSQPCKR